MSIKFKYYRYVVNPISQQLLFANRQKTKKQAILAVLKSDIVKNFPGKKSSLGLAVVYEEGDRIYCRFGKRAQVKRSRSAKEKFEDEKLENWPHCHMFIDMNDHPDGQKIAIEHKTSVFVDELFPLRSLSDQVNKSLNSDGFEMAINPITKEPSFWALVNQHEGDIEELTFNFRVPNLFKLGNTLENDLKDVQREYGATEASLTVKNDKGGLQIPKEEPLISQSVDYIARGGGTYKLKARKKVYTNNDNVLSKTIDVDLETQDKNVMKDIIDKLFQ
jgi:hypothetical protein